MRWLLVVVAGSAVSACFGPDLPTQLDCSNTGLCPAGFGCFDGVCQREDIDGADGDGPVAMACDAFDAHHFDACSIPDPSGALDLDLGDYTYDTDAGTLIDADGNDIAHASVIIDKMRIVSIDALTVGPQAALRAAGSLPLVIASWGAIDVGGVIDVAVGGAASDQICAGAATAGTDAADGAGGGGGGGFGTSGGAGGAGNFDATPVSGGIAGTAMPAPAALRGGCAGATGGSGDTPASSGAGGPAGGAVQLTALSRIVVSGAVDAGGGGGGSATPMRGGGGGGGSGGLVGLDAPTIEIGGTVTANGGGGAEGTGALATSDRGDDGQRSSSPARGGDNGAVAGGAGGDGGVGTGPGQTPTEMPSSGGGGGGGGVGYVLTRGDLTVDPVAVVSPGAQTQP